MENGAAVDKQSKRASPQPLLPHRSTLSWLSLRSPLARCDQSSHHPERINWLARLLGAAHVTPSSAKGSKDSKKARTGRLAR